MQLNLQRLMATLSVAISLQFVPISSYALQDNNLPDQCSPSAPVPFGSLFNPIKFVSREHKLFSGSVYFSGKPSEPQFMLFTIPQGWDWDQAKAFPYSGFTVYVNYGEKVQPYIFGVKPNGDITNQKSCPLNKDNHNADYALYNCKFEGFDKTHPAAAFIIRLLPSTYFINTRIQAGSYS